MGRADGGAKERNGKEKGKKRKEGHAKETRKRRREKKKETGKAKNTEHDKNMKEHSAQPERRIKSIRIIIRLRPRRLRTILACASYKKQIA